MLFNYLSFFALITKLKNLNKLQELEMFNWMELLKILKNRQLIGTKMAISGENKRSISLMHFIPDNNQMLGGDTHVMDLVDGANFLKKKRPEIYKKLQ